MLTKLTAGSIQVNVGRHMRNASSTFETSEGEVAEMTLYGAKGSGSIAVEAAFTLLGVPYSLVEGATWAEEEARERVAPRNPMRQIPTLVLPSGEVLTESAAILLYFSDAYPQAHLAPTVTDPLRPQFLRWMVYVSSAIYSLHWVKPDVRRIGAPLDLRDDVVNAVHDRIAYCWSNMDAQLTPSRYLLGDELTVLDLYVTVVSRFGPWRIRFYESAPKMASVVRRVDSDSRLAEFWPSDSHSMKAGSESKGESSSGESDAQPFDRANRLAGCAILAAISVVETGRVLVLFTKPASQHNGLVADATPVFLFGCALIALIASSPRLGASTQLRLAVRSGAG